MTGDPTEARPCDGMLEEAAGLRARIVEDHRAVLELIDRHMAALASCRSRCWLRGGQESGQ